MSTIISSKERKGFATFQSIQLFLYSAWGFNLSIIKSNDVVVNSALG